MTHNCILGIIVPQQLWILSLGPSWPSSSVETLKFWFPHVEKEQSSLISKTSSSPDIPWRSHHFTRVFKISSFLTFPTLNRALHSQDLDRLIIDMSHLTRPTLGSTLL